MWRKLEQLIMETITEEKYNTMLGTQYGVKSNFTKEVLKLDKGEFLFITKDEWDLMGYRSTPTKLMNCYTNMKQSRLYDRTDLKVEKKKEGWIIKRI